MSLLSFEFCTLHLQDELASGLTVGEFVQMLCMVGQAVFASKRLHRSYMAAEEKLSTFLDLLYSNGPAESIALPSSISQLTVVGGDGGSSGMGASTAQPGLQLGKEDPYEEWWSMQFEGGADAAAANAGSQQLVMLQVSKLRLWHAVSVHI